jgi:hypothetical protein
MTTNRIYLCPKTPTLHMVGVLLLADGEQLALQRMDACIRALAAAIDPRACTIPLLVLVTPRTPTPSVKRHMQVLVFTMFDVCVARNDGIVCIQCKSSFVFHP